MKKLDLKPVIDKFRMLNMKKAFYSNKFIMVFSLIASFSIWVALSASSTWDHPVTISDIPVTISLSESAFQDGLRIFSGQDTKASVSITGNRLIVGQVTKDNIQVTATQAANTITSPGKYPLELTAKKNGILTDYEFASSVQPTFITVMVDRMRESEFNIEPEIDFTANPQYFVGTPVLSSSKVTLSGPESEISKIKKVVIKGRFDSELQNTATLKAPILMYDMYNEPISSETITSTVSEVEATIPVLMKKKVSVHYNFSNKPEGLYLPHGTVKVSPSALEIAGSRDEIEKINELQLPEIDFNKINIQNNKFDLPINIPQGCKSLNNIYSAEVYINTSQFKEKSLWITQFSFLNLVDGKSASVYTGGINVKIVGPAWRINSIKPSDIEALIDLHGKEDVSGSMEVPVKIVINGINDVWVFGEYLVNINIS